MTRTDQRSGATGPTSDYQLLDNGTGSTVGTVDEVQKHSLWSSSSIIIVLLGFFGSMEVSSISSIPVSFFKGMSTIQYSMVMPSLSAYVDKLGGTYVLLLVVFFNSPAKSCSIGRYFTDSASLFSLSREFA